jgi:UDP-N-acetylmuramoyl-L-alanyl-D-glutamate--2,6-diaminopimelate ligase
MTLGGLLDVLATLPGGARLATGDPDAARTSITDVTHDSAQAGPGVLFAARPGTRADGHDFAQQAVGAGAAALLVERVVAVTPAVPQVVVRSVAAAMGPAAAAVHGHPSRELLLLGVTGTNGKTTTTYLLEAALAAAGHRTGVIGTVETRIAGQAVPGVRTTPEATDLQRLLRRMRAAGVTAVAMEVSSHGLALGRVAGARFAAAAFTNLTQDHLDFHADLEDYFAAKALLFTPVFTDRAVVNVDDPWGRRLADRLRTVGEVAVTTVGRVGDPPAGTTPDVVIDDVVERTDGSRFALRLHDRAVPATTRLPGHFNVANAAGAVVTAMVAGVDLDAAVAGVAALSGVPGRMERVDVGQPFSVLVDYAHTPDSLENVLRAARRLAGDRQVLVVVGCGGDRDRAKRPLMGRAAAELADVAVLTSDNPRSEDPRAILDAMMAGARGVAGARVAVEVDRRAGIAAALAAASPGDVVVIAGKGHEPYQELADHTIDFDDRLVARELLAGRGAA